MLFTLWLAFAPLEVCAIVKDVHRFDGQIITVRSAVKIGFEEFELPAKQCGVKNLDGIWLEYGRGPKEQPTMWCCGDTSPKDRLAVVQNADFRRFHRYLTSRTKQWEPKFSVTATITGRVDAVAPTNEGCRQGFGHFGFFCARLVIQSVADVTAEPVSAPPRPESAGK